MENELIHRRYVRDRYGRFAYGAGGNAPQPRPQANTGNATVDKILNHPIKIPMPKPVAKTKKKTKAEIIEEKEKKQLDSARASHFNKVYQVIGKKEVTSNDLAMLSQMDLSRNISGAIKVDLNIEKAMAYYGYKMFETDHGGMIRPMTLNERRQAHGEEPAEPLRAQYETLQVNKLFYDMNKINSHKDGKYDLDERLEEKLYSAKKQAAANVTKEVQELKNKEEITSYDIKKLSEKELGELSAEVILRSKNLTEALKADGYMMFRLPRGGIANPESGAMIRKKTSEESYYLDNYMPMPNKAVRRMLSENQKHFDKYHDSIYYVGKNPKVRYDDSALYSKFISRR